jgi:hypothetical protein
MGIGSIFIQLREKSIQYIVKTNLVFMTDRQTNGHDCCFSEPASKYLRSLRGSLCYN